MCQILIPECYTHSPTYINLMQTVGRFEMWVTHKINKPSFCAILKLSHALDILFSALSRLDGRKHKCAFCWMKDRWTWLLSDIVTCDSFWHGTQYVFIFRYRCCHGYFQCFGWYFSHVPHIHISRIHISSTSDLLCWLYRGLLFI